MTKEPVTVGPDTLISDALVVMRDQDVRHLLVVEGRRLAGVLSNRDYRRVLFRVDRSGTITGVDRITVKEIMTPAETLITASPDTPVMNVGQLMVLKQVGCVPVVAGDGRPLGVVTQKQVMEHLVRSHLPDKLPVHEGPGRRGRS